MAYAGRLAIIAGGLGGLGSAIGRALHARGAGLALLFHPAEAHHRQAALESVYGRSDPEGVAAYECDITSEASVSAAFRKFSSDTTLSSRPSFPSILINAAGYVTVQPLESTSVEEAQKTLDANLMGPFITSKAFHKLYSSRVTAAGSNESTPPGRIISIASQAAHVALGGHGPYCASKAGLLGLTRCMANEWAGIGITANTVSPTVVLTQLGIKAWADESKRNAHLSQIPTGRFSLPEEIASATEFLCRDDSGMINGADIRVDGGFTVCR